MYSEAALKLAMAVLQQESTGLPENWSIEVRFADGKHQIRLVDDDGKVVDTESEGVEPSDVGHLIKVANEIVAARPKCPEHPEAKTIRFWADSHGPGLRIKRGYRCQCRECSKDLGWEDWNQDVPVNATPNSDVAEAIAAFNRDFPIGTKVFVKVDGLFEEPTIVESPAYLFVNKVWSRFYGIEQAIEIKGRVRKKQD